MELIDFKGLNCYYNCIVTVANNRGVDYEASFARLWPETAFKYDPFREAFLTKRMLKALGAMGHALVMLPSDSPEEAAESLSRFDEGEEVIVGLDAFYIPWCQMYGLMHGPHYIIALNRGASMPCFDPTYGRQDGSLPRAELAARAFDVSRILRVPPRQISGRDAASEAKAVLPELARTLAGRIRDCAGENREEAVMAAKYVDALLSNRYLYMHYLAKHGAAFLDEDVFSGWQAVKNGLYKASVMEDNASVLDEVRRLACALVDQELAFAEKMAAAEPSPAFRQ